jgi:hypothetical protein
MPRGELRTVFVGEKLRWFKAQFDLHLNRKHPPQEVNKAAATIVRKAAVIQ